MKTMRSYACLPSLLLLLTNFLLAPFDPIFYSQAFSLLAPISFFTH
jgi:hypothetical protein